MNDRLESGLAPRAPEVVDAGEVDVQVVEAASVVAEETRQGEPVLRRHLENGHVEVGHLDVGGERRLCEPAAQPLRLRRKGRRLDDGAHDAGFTGTAASSGVRSPGDHAALFPSAKRAERVSRDFSPDWIFLCSSKMPYISSSGVGGQPGT